MESYSHPLMTRDLGCDAKIQSEVPRDAGGRNGEGRRGEVREPLERNTI